MNKIITLFLIFVIQISAQVKTINVDSKANCYLIPDSNVVSGLTPGIEYKVSVVANDTIKAPMQGVFFMYADVNSQHHFNYTPIGSSFTFKPINGQYQIAPIYVDWSTKNDNSGSLKITIAPNDKFYTNDINTKLLLYFNETTGTIAYDSSGNGNNATATGTTIVNGIYGNARSFNGTSDFLLANNSSSLNITNQITVEAWVYPTENKMINIFSKEGAYQFYIFTDGTFSIGVYSGYPWHQITSKSTVPLNKWTHIAGTFDNTTKKFQVFKNGVLDNDTTDLSASLTSSTQPLYIGRNGSASVYYVKGMMDEMRISNTVRTFIPITPVANFKNIPKPPTTIILNQNFPNPFNPETTINFDLPTQSEIKLTIYDEVGREIRSLFNGTMQEGNHSIKWDGKDNNGKQISSGTYFYSITSDGKLETKKMILIR